MEKNHASLLDYACRAKLALEAAPLILLDISFIDSDAEVRTQQGHSSTKYAHFFRSGAHYGMFSSALLTHNNIGNLRLCLFFTNLFANKIF
jgi:hypothetical protein